MTYIVSGGSAYPYLQGKQKHRYLDRPFVTLKTKATKLKDSLTGYSK